jgi:hypothetical protein
MVVDTRDNAVFMVGIVVIYEQKRVAVVKGLQIFVIPHTERLNVAQGDVVGRCGQLDA